MTPPSPVPWPASCSETSRRLDLLAPELRAIVEAELAVGNSVVSIEDGRPIKDALTVVLARPFLTRPSAETRNLRYRRLEHPAWWAAEYTTLVPPHTLACCAAPGEG